MKYDEALVTHVGTDQLESAAMELPPIVPKVSPKGFDPAVVTRKDVVNSKHYVPFEAELAVVVFVGSYLAVWAVVFSFLAGQSVSQLKTEESMFEA